MPLVILAGFPCCGKTEFAKQLAQELEKRSKNNSNDNSNSSKEGENESDSSVVKDVDFFKTLYLVNEESEIPALNKRQCYQSSFAEKSTRAAIKSAVSHKVGVDSMVIADSLNYIKGFRYELYCAARSYRSPHCVVWVESSEEASDLWNKERGEAGLTEDLMRELRLRFEAPNSANRWDCPLFRVDMTPANMRNTATSAASNQDNSNSGSSAETSTVFQSVEAAQPKKSAWKPKAKAAKPANSTASAAGNTMRLRDLSSLSIPEGGSVDLSELSLSERLAEEAANAASAAADANNKANEAPAVTGGVWFSGTNVKNAYTSAGETPEAVIEKIIAFFQTASAPAPHASTVNVTHSSADMLYELDRVSKEITEKIIAHQNIIGNDCSPVIFPEYDRSILLQRPVGLVELQRHRRQFVKVNSNLPPQGVALIGGSFIDFLATQI